MVNYGLSRLRAIAPSVEPDRHAWSLAQRIAFRFAGVYLVLYLSDGWLQLLPVGGAVIERWWQALGLWTGRHILHHHDRDRRAPLRHRQRRHAARLRSGCWNELAIGFGRARSYGRWPPRGGADAPVLYQWLRVYVRYPLGIIMLGYGMGESVPRPVRPGDPPA